MTTSQPTRKNVPLGSTVITRGALDALPAHDVHIAMGRHQRGDWGEVCPDDWQENEFSYDKRLRLVSSYTASNGVKFWIITEADRASTTVLLPEEY